jgi:hypothetical protein
MPAQGLAIRHGRDGRLVDTRRLALLLALSRLGSMRQVAEAFALTVSQQIAALAKEAGEQLIEPDGRTRPR